MQFFFIFLFISMMPFLSATDLPLDDVTAAQQFTAGNKKNPNNYSSPNEPFHRPIYAYFYTKNSQVVLHDTPVHLENITLEVSGIRISPLDQSSIFLNRPGRFYVSWQISTTKEFDIDKGLRFALVSPETEIEIPNASFALTPDNSSNRLNLSGESIIDVPRSGLLFQLRNVSGYEVALQPSGNKFSGLRSTLNLSPEYAASIYIIAASIFPSPPESIQSKSSINPSDLEAILDIKGQPLEDQIKFAIPRQARTDEFDLRLDSGMNINSFIAFTGTNEKAIVVGDLVVYEDERESVSNSLKKGNINVVSCFRHASKNKNKPIFLHYKGQGNAKKLAQTIKNSLSSINEHKIYYSALPNQIFVKKSLICPTDYKHFLHYLGCYPSFNFFINPLFSISNH